MEEAAIETVKTVEVPAGLPAMETPAMQGEVQRFEAQTVRWLASMEASQGTKDNYGRAARGFFRWLQNRGTAAPDQNDVLAWREWLTQTHAPATVSFYVAVIRGFFAWMDRTGLYPDIARDVAAPSRTLADRLDKKDALTADQARTLLESVDRSTAIGLRDYAILAVMLTTGLRTVSIASASDGGMEQNEKGTVLHCLDKGGRQTSAKLAPPVWDAVQAWLEARSAVRRDAAGMPLFTSLSDRNLGCRLSTRALRIIIKERLRKIGIDSCRLTAHSLRHTAATLGLQAGGTVDDVRRLLGHADLGTVSLYCHGQPGIPDGLEMRVAEAVFRQTKMQAETPAEEPQAQAPDAAKADASEIHVALDADSAKTGQTDPSDFAASFLPPKKERPASVTMRLSPKIKLKARTMAHECGMSLSEFCAAVVGNAVTAAEKTVA